MGAVFDLPDDERRRFPGGLHNAALELEAGDLDGHHWPRPRRWGVGDRFDLADLLAIGQQRLNRRRSDLLADGRDVQLVARRLARGERREAEHAQTIVVGAVLGDSGHAADDRVATEPVGGDAQHDAIAWRVGGVRDPNGDPSAGTRLGQIEKSEVG